MSVPDKRDRNRRQLKRLLRELFQFDCADLDFGIYRILNAKRDEIEHFIERDLLDAVQEGLAELQTAERGKLEQEVDERRREIVETLGPDAIDPAGNVVKYEDAPVVKRYLLARENLRRAEVAEETEVRIFNDLYTFFSRYYDDGDFLTERRYSSHGSKFCVPYNGEEVLLHWANRDQYYVKTSERFADYRFTSGGYTVWFRLERAEVPQDNVKTGKRYFVPRPENPLDHDPQTQVLTIFFEYRPLAEEEEAHYLGIYNARQSKSSRRKTLDRRTLCTALEAEILGGLDDPTLKAHVAAVPKGQDVSALGKHLNRYTARNTMDYFVHKDLGGFLRRELDFFLKNEVLRLDDVVADESGEVLGHVVTRMRVVRQIALRIIAFLAQIEDFQKRLFEKRKFVVQTDYCVTMTNVPQTLRDEVAANDPQWREWRELLNIEEEKNTFTAVPKTREERRLSFLRAHPTLVLDTRHFGRDFTERLLASVDDLDEKTDALVIHGDNLHAVNLLVEKYRGRVKCIHIDPPYNTQTSGFLYKNAYQHSSWLAMMENRVSASLPLMSSQGSYLCHIDENEYEVLHLLFEHLGTPNGGIVIWDKKNPMLGRKGIATQHEYVLWRTWCNSPIYLRSTNVRRIVGKAQSLVRKHGVTDAARREFGLWLRRCEGLTGGERAYRHIDDIGRVFQSVGMGAPEPRQDPKFHIPLVHPVTKKKCPVPSNGWSRAPETLQELIDRDEIVFGADETVQPRRKVFLTDESKRQLSSVISDAMRGKTDVVKLGLEFPYCHPVSLYEELLGAAAPDSTDVVVDYFAGSGTTGHAVINLNREDGAQRRFILVEMGDCLHTVLLPRLKKVTFTPEWKDGKPARQATEEEAHRSPRIIKYQRIESYEDALNNIRVRAPEGAQRRMLYGEFDDYMLHYMLDVETRESPTLLRPEAFETPFDYTLKIQRGHESPEDERVDLVETFHYLIGMHVRRIEHHVHQDRTYAVSRGEVRQENGVEQTIVIWRDTADLDLGREADWANEVLLTEPVDRVYVNGPSHIRQAQPLEITFRQRMEPEREGGRRGA